MTENTQTILKVDKRPQVSLVRRLSPGLPHLAVLLGMYLLHNGMLAIGLYHLGIILVLLAERRLDVMRGLLRGFHAGLLVVAIVLCLVGGAFTYFFWPIIGLPHFADRLAHVGLYAAVLPWFFLYFSVVNPALEEAFWRGYHRNDSPRPVWNDFWFAGYHVLVLSVFMHWYWLPLVFVGLAAMAWIWRLLAKYLDGLLINAISHIAADAGIVVAVLLVLRST